MGNDFFAKKNIVKQRPVLKYLRVSGADKESHAHPHPEFIFVVGGSGRFETGGNQYPIKTGDLIVCSKDVAHSEYMFEGSTEIYHLGFTNTVLSGMEEDEILTETFCIIHTDTQFEILKAYFDALNNELTDAQISSKIVEEDLMRVLLISVLRLAVTNVGLTYSQNKAFIEAKEYFDKNYLTINNIEEVCKTLGINKFYLTHIFKEQLGMPPIKYLVLKRMDKAKSLLAYSSASVAEIATKSGYTDTAYFCRVFKKVEGVTPLQYRTKNKHVNQI